MANHMLIYLDADTFPRRLKAHIVEIGVAALSSTVGGIVVAASIMAPTTYASSSLSSLPELAVMLLGFTHLLAGALVLLGLLVPRSDFAVEIHTEQAGWILCAVGWAAFGWAMWYFAEGSTVSVALGVILGAVSGLRAWFLGEVEEQARERQAARERTHPPDGGAES